MEPKSVLLCTVYSQWLICMYACLFENNVPLFSCCVGTQVIHSFLLAIFHAFGLKLPLQHLTASSDLFGLLLASLAIAELRLSESIGLSQ